MLAEDLHVPAFNVFPTYRSYESPTLAGPFAQLTTAAIDAGIARAALRDTLAFVREFARPWIDAGVAKASEDPLTIIQVGALDIRLEAAEALLERAGWALDAARSAPDEDSVAQASLAVARAKVLTTEIAIEASNKLFELGGTRSTLKKHNFDRHWRNARVHTLHDPVRWKYHVVGNWLLNGVKPPRHDWS
ncbi:Dibenzothiophene desulfurization enzyme C [compost metagenome]